jgi:hypothetical protein
MPPDRQRLVVVAVGIVLLVGSLYAVLGPGRIDIIDGQYRFEVARNLLELGSLQIGDPFLGGAVQGVGFGDGQFVAYSPYGLSGSIVPLPLLVLAKITGSQSVDRQQFFFSFTSAVLGAATAALLFLFYTTLGIARRPALLWTLVGAFATLAFPAATSVFDQTQQGFFVAAACYLAFLAARRNSMPLAVAGGAALAILVNFQETYAILIPTIGIATLASPAASPEQRRRSFERCLVFMFVGGIGLLVWAGLNNFRFGSLLMSGKGGPNHPSPFGNPLVGLIGLLFSPGKSIFLYSPPTVLALLGLYHLFRRERRLGQAVVASAAAYLALISSLSFFGGDWCWGPRYFVSILPLLALGFPLLKFDTARRQLGIGTLVVAGLAVQLLGVSLDQHPFFYGRSLHPFFWSTDSGFYFRQSALFARPGELLARLRDGVPSEAKQFRPGPYPESLTYAVFGPGGPNNQDQPGWMRHFRVFWLPRPWPLWMATIPETERPIALRTATSVLLALGLAGAVAIRLGAA